MREIGSIFCRFFGASGGLGFKDISDINMGTQAALITLSSLAISCLVPPLAWHIKCRNIPAIILIIWLLLSSIKNVVDSAIWGGSDFASKWTGEIWCDIMVKIQTGADSGVVCAITAIALNLYIILLANEKTIAWFAKPWRKMSIELAICLGTPFFSMGSSYIVSNLRYFIIRFDGCQQSFASTWVVIVLYSMWPFIWSIIALVLSVLTIIKYFQRRKDLRDILKITDSGLNLRRFAGLLVFCVLNVLVMLPLSIYIFVSTLKVYRGKFVWEEIHDKLLYNIVFFVDSSEDFDRWIICALAYVTFLVFGLAKEALNMYKGWLRALGFSFLIDNIEAGFQKRKISLVDKLKKEYQESNERGTSSSDKESGNVEYYELHSLSNRAMSLEGSESRGKYFQNALYEDLVIPSGSLHKSQHDSLEDDYDTSAFLREYSRNLELELLDGDFGDSIVGGIDYSFKPNSVSKL